MQKVICYMHVNKILKYYNASIICGYSSFSLNDLEGKLFISVIHSCSQEMKTHNVRHGPSLSDMNSLQQWQSHCPCHHEDSCSMMFMRQRLNLNFLTLLYKADLEYNSNMHKATLIVLRFYRAVTYCRLMPWPNPCPISPKCPPLFLLLPFKICKSYWKEAAWCSIEVKFPGVTAVKQLWAAAHPIQFPGVPTMRRCPPCTVSRWTRCEQMPTLYSFQAYQLWAVAHIKVVFMRTLAIPQYKLPQLLKNFFLLQMVSPPPQLGSLLMLVCRSPVVSLTCIYLSQIRGSWAILGDNNSLISLC